MMTIQNDDEISSDVATHVLDELAVGSDSITGNKLITSTESILNEICNIRCRKALNRNNKHDLVRYYIYLCKMHSSSGCNLTA